MVTVGDRIYYIRKNQRLTQQQLADLSGLSRQMICSYELGRKEPSFSSMVSIANALKTSLEYFAKGDPEDEKKTLFRLHRAKRNRHT